MADITTIFWGSPQVFWGCVGVWALLLLVAFVSWLNSLGE